MPASDTPTEELASFDPPLAEAVAGVLLAAGVPVTLADAPGGERSVLVPRARREEALAALAARMDEVQALAGSGHAADNGPGADAVYHTEDLDDEDRTLVLDRFRSFGWVAVALVPLLVISLSGVRLPAGVVVALVIGSVVVVSAWRTGRFGGKG